MTPEFLTPDELLDRLAAATASGVTPVPGQLDLGGIGAIGDIEQWTGEDRPS